MKQLGGILETSLYCSDLEAAEKFYVAVLGLDLIGRQCDRHVFFRCGQAVLLLFNPERTSTEVSYVNGIKIPLHGTRGDGHMALKVPDSAIPGWREQLKRHGVAIEAEVHWPGGGQSIYFRDPSGNSIELATAAVWGFEEIQTQDQV